MYYALAALFTAAPLYVLRFTFAGLPLNALEILIPIFLLVFFIRLAKNRQTGEFIRVLKAQPKINYVLISLLAVASIISFIISPDHHRALGLLGAFFIEPMLVYFPALYIFSDSKNRDRFAKWLFIVIGIVSAYAIVQYFTLAGLPKQWWGNSMEPKRALSVFEYPNAYALYLAPILAFLLPFIFQKNTSKWYKVAYIIGLLGLLLSLSRGGWLGLGVAAAFFAFFLSNRTAKKYLLGFALGAVIIIAAVPNLRYRVILPFVGEKSTVSRYSLWHTADKMIKSSPLMGKGLYGFQTDFNQYNTDPNLQPINFPHNIFLNFWVETGLLGLISFTGICIVAFIRSWKTKTLAATGLMLFLLAIFVHGQVDAPYLKNDLALIFWIILAMI
ncbi:O-antigen ligase family protein [Patescibacteria group bacterium]|nr:O-antigen ligase family protein [Patescibacteria group bacterium]